MPAVIGIASVLAAIMKWRSEMKELRRQGAVRSANRERARAA